MYVEAVLRHQSGVISRRQALAAGMSRHQVDRLISARRWLAVHPGVYLVADRDLGDEARVHAAALWVGDGATLSGLTAAWWHRLWPDPPSIVEVTAPRASGSRRARGVLVRRRALLDADRIAIRGQWVTDIPLTVLEAAVALQDRGSQLMDRALQRRVGFDALQRAHVRNLGRRGSGVAARLLAAASDRAASAAERKAIGLLRAAGLAGWRPHYRQGGYELDLAFPEQRVAIEVDGWAWHHDAETFRNDRQRQNALVLAGWTVLRFTWHDLTQRPDEVVAEIRASLHTRQFGRINSAQRG